MNITYDKEADCLYITIAWEPFGTTMFRGTLKATKAENEDEVEGTGLTTTILDRTLFDLGDNGEILGIEVINASKHYSQDFLDKCDPL